MKDVVIVSAARTPIGRFGKSLNGVTAVKLGETAMKEAGGPRRNFSGIRSTRLYSAVFFRRARDRAWRGWRLWERVFLRRFLPLL